VIFVDIWARLSIYESTDLVRELFQRRHGRELNAEKAREIVSAIAQGREYFSSASEAGLLVRPLLQYYGVLSLCRGLVLLLSQNLRETSLPQAHGLSAVSWESRLATSAWRPADLEVKVTGGTFFSMLENTHNSEFSTVFTAPYPNNLMFLQAWPVAGLNGARLTFQQVLSRISELRDVYERSFGQCASNYRAFVFTLSATTQTDIDLFDGRHGLPPEQQLRQELSIAKNISLRSTAHHNWLPHEMHQNYRLLHPAGTNFTDLLPQIENLPDKTMSIVARLPSGQSISRIGRFFLLSYFLGMFARYHPTSWLTIMQSRQKGDFMLPIIRESMNAVQQNFPVLVIRELEG
jgi:YaaC-like Protein